MTQFYFVYNKENREWYLENEAEETYRFLEPCRRFEDIVEQYYSIDERQNDWKEVEDGQ